MHEYDTYLPTIRVDDSPVDAAKTERIKESLSDAFSSCTHLRQHSEGSWRLDGVTFRALKRRLEKRLQQEEVLIVSRAVEVL